MSVRDRAARALLCGLLVAGLACVSAAGLAGGVKSAGYPRCFGAASRDPQHPCHNPALRLLVVPTPSEALITPAAPCTLVPSAGPPEVCAFGVPPDQAVSTFALIGDSHAAHWRAALEVVAQAKHWRGLSLDHSLCPLSLAYTMLREPLRTECFQWRLQVFDWLNHHPEIQTVVVSAHSGGAVQAAHGQRQFAAKVEGFLAAWRALPPSVAHIIVIRNVPYSVQGMLACVSSAMTRHQPAGELCERPRAIALHRDPEVAAAQQLHSARVQVADMTHFMCDRRWCFPVVGGALVRKDLGHLTQVFSASLGPYLLRRIDRLASRWR